MTPRRSGDAPQLVSPHEGSRPVQLPFAALTAIISGAKRFRKVPKKGGGDVVEVAENFRKWRAQIRCGSPAAECAHRGCCITAGGRPLRHCRISGAQSREPWPNTTWAGSSCRANWSFSLSEVRAAWCTCSCAVARGPLQRARTQVASVRHSRTPGHASADGDAVQRRISRRG